MGSVWKRLQRAGKRAAKVRFEATLEELLVEGGGSWTPDRLTVVWSRRHRRVCSKPRRWQPGIQNPQRGMVVWVVPETLEVVVTLYRDPQATAFDDKSWNFLVVNESRGRRSVVAAAPLELGRLAGLGDTPMSLALRPRTRKVTAATLRLRLRGLVLMEGHPTDEDMQSVTSLSPPGDVADLGDFESDPEDEGGPHRVGGAPPAPRAPPPRGDPPTLGTQRHPPEPGGDSEPPPKITAGPPGGRGALLAWCRGVTAGYPGVSITDFGGSWSSGLGFCALLHRLRPLEIDFDALDPRDHRGNNRRAFDAFAALGVPRLLDPSDMETPDSLGVMTFLSQVRALLGTPPGTPPDPRSGSAEGGPQETPKEPPPDPRSGSIEEETPPESPSDVIEGRPQMTPPETPPEPRSDVIEEGPQMTPPETPPEPRSDVIEEGPQMTPPGTPPEPQSGSSEEEPQEPPQTPPETQTGTPPEPQISATEGGPQETPPDPPQLSPIEEGAPPDPSLSPVDGGLPLEPPQFGDSEGEPPQDPTEGGQPPQDPQPGPPQEEPPQDPPKDPTEGGLPQLGPPQDPQLSPPQLGRPQDPPPSFGEGAAVPGPPPPPGAARGGEGGSPPAPPPLQEPPPPAGPPPEGERPPPRNPPETPKGDVATPPAPPPSGERWGRGAGGRGLGTPPGGGIWGHLRVPSPPPETPKEPPEEESGGQWVVAELVALEQDQARLDAQAPALERELRALMDSGADPAREERLLRDWFALVQQRNLLVRRQDQLQLLAQERDLERRFELLSRELRGLLGTEEWQKPPAQRQREQLLLEELVALVNRRDRLVRDRHRRETRAQEEDEELERSLDPRRRRFGRRETCGIC
ncbi:EH domain-binding protein 1-like protein 1 [Hirundo rustica]|uniref:EH domain-binding protein 1-like protein 1 n=1 Tax=Hirundo rustica TaxID=43150 RepID=UPI001A94DD23|nr:EH domain-binding protein 1-like protein 1 [Hirundo rustica]